MLKLGIFRNTPQGNFQGIDSINAQTSSFNQKKLNSLAFAISLCLYAGSSFAASNGIPGHVGNSAPTTSVTGTNGGDAVDAKAGDGGAGAIITNPTATNNVTPDNIGIVAGKGGNSSGTDVAGGTGGSATAGNGGDGLIFTNLSKDKNLTTGQDNIITAGNSGEVLGGDGKIGGNATGGNGGNVSFIGNNFTNNATIITGYAEAAIAGNGDEKSGNAISGHGGSFSFTGNTFENNSDINTGHSGSAFSMSDVGNTGTATGGNSGAVTLKGQNLINNGSITVGMGGAAYTQANQGTSGNAIAGHASGILIEANSFTSNNALSLGFAGSADSIGELGSGNAVGGNNLGLTIKSQHVENNGYIELGNTGAASTLATGGSSSKATAGKHFGFTFIGEDFTNTGGIYGGLSGDATSAGYQGSADDAKAQDAVIFSFTGNNLTNTGTIQLGNAGRATSQATGGNSGDVTAGKGGSIVFNGKEFLNSMGNISLGNGGDAYAITDNGTTGNVTAGDGGQILFNGTNFYNDSYIAGGLGGNVSGNNQLTSANTTLIAGNGGGIVFKGQTFTNDENGYIYAGSGGDIRLENGEGTLGNGAHAISVEQDNSTIINKGTLVGGNKGSEISGNTNVTGGSTGAGLLLKSNNNKLYHSGGMQAGADPTTGIFGDALLVQGNNNLIELITNSTFNGDVTIAGVNNRVVGDTEIDGDLYINAQNIVDAISNIDVTKEAFIELGAIVDITSVDAQNATKVFLTTQDGITGDFTATIGGSVSPVDYLSAYAEKINGDKDYQVTYGLSWYATDPLLATGNFTLVDKEHSFTVNTDLVTVASPNVAWDGNALNKKGNGTLTLNGVNTYTGPTNVEAGTLVLGGSSANSSAQIAGDVNIHNGATLTGHGSIFGNTSVNNGATIAVGNGEETTSTLTTGSIDFSSGSIFEVKIKADGTNDKIDVSSANGGSGIATINGGLVSALAEPGAWSTATSYTILSSDNGVNGTFNGVKTNLAFLTPIITYDPNNVYLTVERNSTALGSVGNTYNQQSTGSAIGSLDPNSPVYNVILGMDADTARRAYDNLSGEIYASTKSALAQNSRYVRDALNNHLMLRAYEPEENLWFSSWGHQGNIRSDGNGATISNSGAGFLAGVDLLATEKGTVGVALGYEHTNVGIGNGRDSKAKLDTTHFTVYGATKIDQFDLRGGLGYSYVTGDISRDIWVSGLATRNKADYRANLYQAFVEGSRTFQVSPQLSVTPYTNLAHVHIRTQSATEKNTTTALKAKRQIDNFTYSTIGLRTNLATGKSDKVTLYSDLGWQHAFNGKAVDSRMQFREGGNGYKVRAPFENNSAIIGAGLNINLTKQTQLSLGYQGEFGKKTTDNSANLRLEYKF